MKILIVNPNTSSLFTAAIQAEVDRYKSPGTEAVAINPTSGPRTIESVYEQLLSSIPSLEILIPYEAEYDGFIIACYGHDPLLQAMHEITSKPVLGINEASLYMACMVGHRFSIVTTGKRTGRSWDTLRRYGLEHRCVSVRPAGLSVQDMESSGEATVRQVLLETARKAVEEDGADVIVLGCAGMTGLDKEIQRELNVPVIDGVVAALKLMEGLIGYGVGTSKRGSYQLPRDKELLNTPPLFHQPYRGKRERT